MYLHAERHVANAGGSKRNGRGIAHPFERERSGSGKGEAQRRAAQAKRGSLGKPVASARGQRPLEAFREGRCGEGKAPLRWVMEDAERGWNQGGVVLPRIENDEQHS